MSRLISEYKGCYGKFFQKEAIKSLESMKDTFIDDNQVIRWRSNKQVPPEDLLELWYAEDRMHNDFDYDLSVKARISENAAFIGKYLSECHSQCSPEEKAEMRSVFGYKPVVDVITGKRVL